VSLSQIVKSNSVERDGAVPQLLTVSCEHYLSDARKCIGACTKGHIASVEQCESCVDYQQTKLPSMLARAASLGKNIVSRIGGQKVPPHLQEERLNICRSCAHLRPSEQPSDVGWCKACGCPSNAMTLLSVKAQVIHNSCPKKFWRELTVNELGADAYLQPKPLD
jgi:hypothetical protein